MRRFVLIALLLVLARTPARACEPRMFGPDDMVTNEPVYSGNGRYLVIERQFEGVADFESARAGAIFNFDPPQDDAVSEVPPEEPPKKPPPRTFAVYEANTRTRFSEFAIPVADTGDVLVSNSGYVAIVRPPDGFCHYSAVEPARVFVTIVRFDGATVARLTAADVLTVSDMANFQPEFARVTPRMESEDRDILVLAIAGYDRRIDLASGKLLDEKVNVVAQPVVFVDAAPRDRPYSSEPFDDASAVHLTSKELLGLAGDEPLPPYPDIAQKARITGPVWVEIRVSEHGEVVAARATKIPFGVTDAALAAVRKWRFRPLQVHGKHVQYDGEIAMHFEHKVVQ